MKDIKKYCLPSIVPAVLISAFIFAFSGGMWYLFNSSSDSDTNNMLVVTIFCLIFFAVGVGLFYALYGRYNSMFKKRWEYFQRMGVTGLIEQDFQRGVRWFENKLIVGENFLFGKSNAMIVMYSEINMLFRHEHKTEYESGRSPTYSYDIKINSNGKEYTLCNLSRKMVESRDWYQFCNFLSLKNPNIQVSQYIKKTHSVVDDTSSGDD